MVTGAGISAWLVKRQGPGDDWTWIEGGRAEADALGILTLSAPTWPAMARVQGQVTASERLFQMDMMRRKASGRLAEWVGRKALDQDVRRLREGWREMAQRVHEGMTGEERAVCDAYAEGVNDFVARFPFRWGLEYVLMGVRPEPWACSDSILVAMLLAEDLNATSDRDVEYARWLEHIPRGWVDRIFPREHPWNRPWFARTAEGAYATLDPSQQAPPRSTLVGVETSTLSPLPSYQPEVDSSDDLPGTVVRGSNSWAYRSRHGYFVANDPHLDHGVPQLWLPLRMRVGEDDWVVGASLPGLPEIVIGMTSYFAWSFTNAGEDVDDLLLETVSEDGRRVLTGRPDTWSPVTVRSVEIPVRGEGAHRVELRSIEGRPLWRAAELGGRWVSRQWLVLQPGLLDFPFSAMRRARTEVEFDAAADRMTMPSQNLLYMNRRGDIFYRLTGTGIRRRADAREPLLTPDGRWLGFEDPRSRPRRAMVRASSREVDRAGLGTANQRIYLDTTPGHRWAGDERQTRIEEVLAQDHDLDARDMEMLQLDTESRYFRILADWLLSHGPWSELGEGESVRARLAAWDGRIESDPDVFSMLDFMDRRMTQHLVGAVLQHFVPKEHRSTLPRYRHALRTALNLSALAPEALQIFGMTPKGLAQLLMAEWERRLELHQPWSALNRTKVQHPLYKSLGFLGTLFRVPIRGQPGHPLIVRVEGPVAGASMRVIWDMKTPSRSRWTFPLGCSGHAGSPRYSNLAARWGRDELYAVFPEEGWDVLHF